MEIYNAIYNRTRKEAILREKVDKKREIKDIQFFFFFFFAERKNIGFRKSEFERIHDFRE